MEGEHSEKPTEKEAESAQAIRVLVVDDDKATRILNKRLLGVFGVDDVTTASSGEEALKLLESGELFDGIIMDNTMTGRKGSEIFAEIRQNYPGLFHVLSTGDDFSEEEIESMKGDIELLLSKGSNIQEFEGVIEKIKTFKKSADTNSGE